MEPDLSARDLMILGAFPTLALGDPAGVWVPYRTIVAACLPAFHPTPHELIRLRKSGFVENFQHGRGRRKWRITDKAIERLEVAGG